MSEQDLDLLENYLKEGKANVEFEKRLANETDLAEALASMSVVNEGYQRLALRDKIRTIHKRKLSEWEDDKVVAFKPKITYVKIASMLAAACLVFTIYLGTASFKLPDNIALKERSASDTSVSENQVYQDYIEAQEMLANGKYLEAANGFRILKSNEGLRVYYQDAASWFEVVALSEIDENKAAQLLENLESKEDFKYPISLIERLKMKVRLWF